jgi:hypothetical protein
MVIDGRRIAVQHRLPFKSSSEGMVIAHHQARKTFRSRPGGQNAGRTVSRQARFGRQDHHRAEEAARGWMAEFGWRKAKDWDAAAPVVNCRGRYRG